MNVCSWVISASLGSSQWADGARQRLRTSEQLRWVGYWELKTIAHRLDIGLVFDSATQLERVDDRTFIRIERNALALGPFREQSATDLDVVGSLFH